MKTRLFNESANDSDIRDQAHYSCDRLKIKETKNALRLKLAHDAHEKRQLKYGVEHEFDII